MVPSLDGLKTLFVVMVLDAVEEDDVSTIRMPDLLRKA